MGRDGIERGMETRMRDRSAENGGADRGNADGAGADGEAARRAAVVVDAAARLLEDCAGFVMGVPDGVYGAPSTMLPGGTIGKHLRHLLDHYMAITRAIGDGTPIQYDRREREVLMETCREAVGRAIRETIETLREDAGGGGGRVVRVRLLVTADRGEVEVGSTLARELLFATHHAVHHCAMMKAIAIELGVRDLRGGGTFGLAPATVRGMAGGGA